MRRDTSADFKRAVAFEDAFRARLSAEHEPFRWGTAQFNDSLPAIYDVNYLLVQDGDPKITAAALMEEAERLMAPRGLQHRKVMVNDEETAERVADGFRAAGWDVDRLLIMIHITEPQRTAAVDVDEISTDVHTAARYAFNQESPYFRREEELEQMKELSRRITEVTDKRCFAAYVDGKIASVCELYSDGVTAQIEDVATLEEFRARGLATATVLRALKEAQTWGHDLIFLVADDEDWPKEMYAKLGFEGVGRIYQFLRRPEDPPSPEREERAPAEA